MKNIVDYIQNEINTNDVVLFIKGTPEAPKCGFSAVVVKILNYLEVNFQFVDVLTDEALRHEVKLFSDWPTFPQLYIKGEFIGGADIVREMFKNQELQSLLKQKSIRFLQK